MARPNALDTRFRTALSRIADADFAPVAIDEAKLSRAGAAATRWLERAEDNGQALTVAPAVRRHQCSIPIHALLV